MLATLPSTWFSGVTMGFIFLHSIAEFSFFVLRWLIVHDLEKKQHLRGTMALTVAVLAALFTVLTILIMLTDSAYWKGTQMLVEFASIHLCIEAC